MYTYISVADPHHLDADPNPDAACNFDTEQYQDFTLHFDKDPDPDPTFDFDVDPDPDPTFQIEALNLEKCSSRLCIYVLYKNIFL